MQHLLIQEFAAVPAGYELCITGDIAFEGDSVNVEVRKAEKSVYVSYIDEETKMPLENAIEELKVAADATSFNTSVLAAVPAGYELCAVGDVYIGENDTVNVEVRKVVTERTVYVSYIDEETKMPLENAIEELKVEQMQHLSTQVFLQQYQQAMSFAKQVMYISVRTIQ